MAPPSKKLRLGLTMEEWMKLSLKAGITAVIDKWGDPNSHKKRDLKADLLEKALTAVENSNPIPTQAEVLALISSKTPKPQLPALKGLPNGLPKDPFPRITIAMFDNPQTPENPKLPVSQGPLSRPAASQHERPPSAGISTPSGPPKDGSTQKDVHFTVHDPQYDPQLEDGLELVAGNFHDQLTGLLSRYFHRVPMPSAGEQEEPLPVRDEGDLSDLNALQLADLFDNEHDPCITSYSLAFRNFSTRDYFPGRTDRNYSCRGRGPVWSDNSCALDTVIVAGKLLDIGRIVCDTGPYTWQEYASRADIFGKACLQLFREPWGILTEAESIRRRDQFYHLAIAESSKMGSSSKLAKHGSFQSSVKLWDQCTTMAIQFSYTQFSRNFCLACQQQTRLYPEPDARNRQPPLGTVYGDIMFDELSDHSTERPDMQQMLTRHFGTPSPSRVHQGCTSAADGERTVQTRIRVVDHGGLSPRLVIKPSTNYRNIRGATNDKITFTYLTLEGQAEGHGPWQQTGLRERTATYRWLGGIYKHNQHYRVYWQDSEYIVSNGNVKVYDGKLFSGAIVGEFPPCKPGFKVPREWSDGTDLLFYEEINEYDRKRVMAEVRTVLTGVLAGFGKSQPPAQPPAIQIKAAGTPIAKKKPAAPQIAPKRTAAPSPAGSKKLAAPSPAGPKKPAATKASQQARSKSAEFTTPAKRRGRQGKTKSAGTTPDIKSSHKGQKRPADDSDLDELPKLKRAKLTVTKTP
ncbi:hypothetical protein MMC32_005456 [Xylographa parallela]|nr:hypothetical protein [Xylographa parallela]